MMDGVWNVEVAVFAGGWGWFGVMPKSMIAVLG